MKVSNIRVLHLNVNVVYDTLNTEEDRRTTFQKEVCRHYYAITGYIGEEGDIVKACTWLLENGIYKLVAHLSVEDELTEIGHLERGWRMTNTIDRYWPENVHSLAGSTFTVFGKEHRSSSVGDLFILDGKKFMAATCGFTEVK